MVKGKAARTGTTRGEGVGRKPASWITEEAKGADAATEKVTTEATREATREATEKVTEKVTEKATTESTEKATRESTNQQSAPRAARDFLPDGDGWVPAARRVPSPNFDARPDGAPVDLVVLHNISLPPGQFGSGDIEAFFQNRLDATRHPFFETIRDVQVSAHFLVTREGELVQFVACTHRAWHAGQSDFLGRPRCNDFSIGIEIEGADDQPFTLAQYATAAALVAALRVAYPITAVAGHSDIAPGRKTDPGPHFDWDRFALLADVPPALLPYRPVV